MDSSVGRWRRGPAHDRPPAKTCAHPLAAGPRTHGPKWTPPAVREDGHRISAGRNDSNLPQLVSDAPVLEIDRARLRAPGSHHPGMRPGHSPAMTSPMLSKIVNNGSILTKSSRCC